MCCKTCNNTYFLRSVPVRGQMHKVFLEKRRVYAFNDFGSIGFGCFPKLWQPASFFYPKDGKGRKAGCFSSLHCGGEITANFKNLQGGAFRGWFR